MVLTIYILFMLKKGKVNIILRLHSFMYGFFKTSSVYKPFTVFSMLGLILMRRIVAENLIFMNPQRNMSRFF